jgi:alkanesulfonate monooxygenase SsuD/methylene tetrahydromethanopterin reductase-like flavin-dependent oxidoreductase (luciferase family)
MRVGFALPQFGGQARQAGRVAWFAAEAERLGTSVLNLPWYPPIALARSLTTIDGASGGRLIPGFGAGWSPDEYRAAGVPWRNRGAQIEDSLDALEAIWTTSPGNPVSYHGAVWEMPDSYVDLKPVQRPRLPVYLGGVSEAALRRIGRRADGWLPAGRIPGAFEPGQFLRQREIIQQGAEEAGRDITGMPATVRVNARAGTSEQQIVDVMGKVARGTGIEDFFVDLMYLAGDVEKALDIAARILELTPGRYVNDAALKS